MQLRKNKSSWKDLRTAMIKRWATLSDLNEELEHLKNMVQVTEDTVQMYTIYSRLAKSILKKGASLHLDTYEAAKELAVKME
ncbi:2933_t:CDS:2, partial [Cetraspora pellucida]